MRLSRDWLADARAAVWREPLPPAARANASADVPAAAALPPWPPAMARTWPVRVVPSTPSSVTPPIEEHLTAWPVLLTLTLSLFGFLGVAGLLYGYKFDALGAYWHGVATRDVFVLSLGLAACPLLLTFGRRVPWPCLPLPIALIFLLYPLLNPFGIPYDTDAVFNFSFAQAIATTGTWSPNLDVAGQALTYSYFPGGAVYNAEFAALTGIPLITAFSWAFPVFRLLVLPGAVYGVGRALFGGRVAMLGTLFYLGIPSIEFGEPTQQDFAVAFFALVVVGVVYLATTERHRFALGSVTLAFSAAVIVSHHVSAYVLLLWLAAMAVLPFLVRRWPSYRRALAPLLFGLVFVAWDLYSALVSYPVLALQYGLLKANVAAVLHPSSAPAAPPTGGTFPLYQDAWLGVAVILLTAGAVIALLERYRRRDEPFTAYAILSSLLVGVVALPFVSTGFSFLALRLLEYVGVVLCPAAGWWFMHRLGAGALRQAERYLPRRRPARRRPGPAAYVVPVIASFVLVTGGSLVALTSRDQFAPATTTLIDAPRYVGPNALSAAQWADAHLNASRAIWGDELATTTFAGFGHLHVRYDGYPLFNGTGFSPSAVAQLSVGDYVALDAYMTTLFLPDEFDGPASEQPATAIPSEDLQKFFNPFYFAEIYQNSVFTIFEIVRVPPPS